MNQFLYDAHAHLGTENERQERAEKGITTLLCGTCFQEIKKVEQLSGPDGRFPSWLIPTYGLHPWHADKEGLKELLPALEQCPVIGEIGMDSVWCSVPLDIQEAVFVRQLDYASQAGKPVILHTKGQESRIARLISEFPNTYLIHWYSAEDGLEAYRKLDCYYTIGPDVWWNPAVRQVADQVPLDRLLIETDGLGAVSWANEAGGRCPEETGLPSVEQTLMESAAVIAGIRSVEPETMLEILHQNFKAFLALGKGKS